MNPNASTTELRLRAAIDSAPSGILMIDAEGRIVLVNRQVEAMFGYAREELLGREVEMLLPERYRANHPRDRASFFASPRVRAMGAGRELYGLRKDRTEVPLEIGLTPLVTDQGMFVLSALVDVSARKRAEERFRAAVESSPNGMLMIGRDGRIVLVNREIERMFGYAREELLGQAIEVLVPARYRARHPADRTSYFDDPRPRSMGEGRELFGVRKDGAEIPLEIGLNPIETEEGVFVLGSVVDISGRKRAEQDRSRLEEQLRQAQKMEAIGRLASGIAHDFNNVLMGIVGCSGLVRQMLPEDHPARSAVDDISEAAKRGASLSRDLLNFGRHKSVEVTPSELNGVVRIAERMLRQVLGEDLLLEVELCPSGGPVLGNPTHLEHILLNLAVNSRDAMPRGGRLRIATRDVELAEPLQTRGRMLHPGSYVALEVADTGSGMDATTLDRIFEPFFTTKEPGTGTGLGLYTVYSIVEQLKGGIDVESEAGKGTRFVIHFPRCNAIAATVAPPTIVPDTRKAGERPRRILIVEDERLIRATLRHHLVSQGYDVLVAATGALAIDAAREQKGPIDLLLSDIVLPDASGSDVAKLLCAERPDLRVLFMSAYPAELLIRQGRIAPGTTTLEKPFDEQALTSAVRASLASPPRSFVPQET